MNQEVLKNMKLMNKNNLTKFKETEIGAIPEEWDVLNVGKIGRVITGKTPPTSHSEYYGPDYPFIKIPDMTESVYVTKTETKISKKGAEYLGKAMLPKNSIMVSCIATIGNVGITSEESFTNQQINSIVPNSDIVDFKYLYYFFKNNKIFLESLGGGGSVYINISKSKFESMPVVLPAIEEQKRIAEILSLLDSKIELNKQISSNLEKIANATFRKWFINIDERLSRGWTDGKLSDLVDNIVLRYDGDNEIDKFPYVPIDMISSKSLSLYNVSNPDNAKSSLVKFKKDDILFGAMRPYFHKVCIAPFEGLTRTTCFVLRAKDKKFVSFCAFMVFQEETINYANSHSEGSTMPYAKWNNSLENMPIKLPPVEIMEKFNDLMYPVLEKIRDNFFENKNLTTIRDSLLPKLMSGKIRVK